MKTVALLLGVVLLALGLAGFVPALNPDGLLFGVMPMNTVMSALFALSGIAGIALGMSSRRTLTPPSNAGPDDMRPWV
jgi:Na+/melibiose symporter-like transporter